MNKCTLPCQTSTNVRDMRGEWVIAPVCVEAMLKWDMIYISHYDNINAEKIDWAIEREKRHARIDKLLNS